ncbi:MAG: hypothetical protein ACYS22_06725 [Planctomycetota bacterium]
MRTKPIQGQARARLAVLAPLALLVMSSGLAGCASTPDPGAATLGVQVALSGPRPREEGRGRLWVRLIPESTGVAIESRLEWTLLPDGEVVLDARGIKEPGTALFPSLAPDRYTLGSFSVSARLEAPDASPRLVSLSGGFDDMEPVAVGSGELVDLGTLLLVFEPQGLFRFQVSTDRALERLAAVPKAHPKLADLAPVARPLEGGNLRLPAGNPVLREVPEPEVKTTNAEPQAMRGDGAAVVGLSAAALGVLTEATSGSGVLQLHVRPMGTTQRPAPLEIPWQLEEATPSNGSSPPEKSLRLQGPALPGPAGTIAAAVAMRPGRYEISAVIGKGSVWLLGGDRNVFASATLRSPIAFEVEPGELVDLGLLRFKMESRTRAHLSALPAHGTARVEALRQEDPALIPAKLNPVARPIRERAEGE